MLKKQHALKVAKAWSTALQGVKTSENSRASTRRSEQPSASGKGQTHSGMAPDRNGHGQAHTTAAPSGLSDPAEEKIDRFTFPKKQLVHPQE